MIKKHLKQFLDLTFDPEDERAKEILEEMRTMDSDEITIEEYLKKCLKTIPETIPEQMFVVFTTGSLQGEYHAKKEMETN